MLMCCHFSQSWHGLSLQNFVSKISKSGIYKTMKYTSIWPVSRPGVGKNSWKKTQYKCLLNYLLFYNLREESGFNLSSCPWMFISDFGCKIVVKSRICSYESKNQDVTAPVSPALAKAASFASVRNGFPIHHSSHENNKIKQWHEFLNSHSVFPFHFSACI